MPGVFFLSPQPTVVDPGQQTVHNNATITTDGYQAFTGYGTKEIILFINIKNSPTGTSPTLTFTIQEVDPIDQTTTIGSPISSGLLTVIGTSTLTMITSVTGTVKVAWTIGGTSSPTFTGVNVTLLQKSAGGTITANAGTGNFTVVQATAANLNATVIGTVTANIGTTNGLALDATVTKLTISQGTALGSNTQILIGGSVTTAAPSYTTGNINPLSLTTAGLLRIDGSGVTQPVSGTVTANQGTSPWVNNITQFGGTNISTGTGTSGTGIPRVTVSNDSNILATQSGTWTVQPGNTANTTPWLMTDSSDGPVTPGTVAGKSSLVGGQFNTSLPTLTNTQQSAIQLDSSGRQIIVGTGIAGTPSGGVLTIQGVSGGTTVPVSIASISSGTADATATGALGALNATVQLTTAGLASVGMQLAAGTLVGTLIPEISYDGGTTWNSSYFSDIGTGTLLGTIVFGSANGALAKVITTPGGSGITRVRVSAYTSGTANITIRASTIIDPISLYSGVTALPPPPNTLQVGGYDGTNLRALSIDTSGRQIIVGPGTADSLVGGVVSSQNVAPSRDRITSGTITALNGTVSQSVQGTGIIGIQITGTWVATLSFESTVDGSTWSSINAVPQTPGSLITSTTVNGSWRIASSGFNQIRIRASLFTSGTATITLESSSGSILQTLNTDSSGNLQVLIQSSPSGSTANIAFGDINLSSITTAAVLRTAYTEQAVNFTGSIVSSSASDAAAGTGARTVKITFVDQTGATAGTETVTLNGTTAVNLVTTTKCFIEKIEVVTVGATGSNVGIIALHAGAGGAGTTIGTIAATDNETFWAHHYVITGKSTSITGIIGGSTASTVGAGSSYALKVASIGVANAVEKQVSDTIQLYGQANQVTRNYTTAIPVAVGPARLTMYVTTQSNTSITYRSSFDYVDQ